MRISDWSSDVCSSDLSLWDYSLRARYEFSPDAYVYLSYATGTKGGGFVSNDALLLYNIQNGIATFQYDSERARSWEVGGKFRFLDGKRSEEHTSELQSLMRISYAVFCLKKKNTYD